MSIGFKIIENFERPDPKLVKQFRNIPVANIDDQMHRIYAVDPGIKPLNKTPLCGVAFTVKAPSGDNLMFHKAMDIAQPGDIIVVEGVGIAERAFSGEIMAHYAMFKKLGGFVIDGYVRDLEATSQLSFPVYARGIEPNGPLKNGPGEINVPVAIGGQVIFPGDIIVGDQDGLIAIRPEYAEEVLGKAKALVEAEIIKKQKLDSGINGLNRAWIQKTLEASDCSYE